MVVLVVLGALVLAMVVGVLMVVAVALEVKVYVDSLCCFTESREKARSVSLNPPIRVCPHVRLVHTPPACARACVAPTVPSM